MSSAVRHKPRVLIIDDNEGICSALSSLLQLHQMEVRTANSPDAGLAVLKGEVIDLVIQDMNFTRDTSSGEEGIELFHEIRRYFPAMPIILLTAWAQLETAVKLVKEGASDYLAKPWDDQKLMTTILNILGIGAKSEESTNVSDDDRVLRRELRGADLCETIFESSAMLKAIHLAVKVADSDLPVLITGPNGTGKEKIAQIIHNNSGRNGPMVSANMGALPDNLLESELFGTVKGAYTGATNREGRFAQAHKGSLFLDEIGNLSHSGQSKLLRVSQTGTFQRLGSEKNLSVDVRLICATNADLKTGIEQGEFREDLYYRINAIHIKMPALKDRIIDILPLAHHFLKPDVKLSAEAEQMLIKHTWPGNVRELENTINRAQVLAKNGVIEVSDLHIELVPETQDPSAIELEDIRTALRKNNGVVSRAAKSLGLSRQAFYRRMEKYGLKEEDGD